MPPIPSGADPSNPTRVLRSGCDAGCPHTAEMWGAGRADVIIDLTDVEWRNQIVDIDAELGAGQLDIKLPADVTARVNARVGVGQIDVFGRTSEGLGVGRSVTVEGPTDGGEITLTVRVGAGQITVFQESNS